MVIELTMFGIMNEKQQKQQAKASEHDREREQWRGVTFSPPSILCNGSIKVFTQKNMKTRGECVNKKCRRTV